MSELIPSDRDALIQAIRYAIAFWRGKAVPKGMGHQPEAVARMTAERIVDHLEESNYLVMRRPVQTAPAQIFHQVGWSRCPCADCRRVHEED